MFIGPRPEETIPNPTWCLGISMVWERGRRKYGWEVDFPKEDYEVEVDESGKEDGTAVTMGGGVDTLQCAIVNCAFDTTIEEELSRKMEVGFRMIPKACAASAIA